MRANGRVARLEKDVARVCNEAQTVVFARKACVVASARPDFVGVWIERQKIEDVDRRPDGGGVQISQCRAHGIVEGQLCGKGERLETAAQALACGNALDCLDNVVRAEDRALRAECQPSSSPPRPSAPQILLRFAKD